MENSLHCLPPPTNLMKRSKCHMLSVVVYLCLEKMKGHLKVTAERVGPETCPLLQIP